MSSLFKFIRSEIRNIIFFTSRVHVDETNDSFWDPKLSCKIYVSQFELNGSDLGLDRVKSQTLSYTSLLFIDTLLLNLLVIEYIPLKF